MAIKTYVYNSNVNTIAEKMTAALQPLVTNGFYGSILCENGNFVVCHNANTNAIEFYIAFGNTLSCLTEIFYGGTSIQKSLWYHTPNYVYTTSHGAYIEFTNNYGKFGGIILSRTNNGTSGVVQLNAEGNGGGSLADRFELYSFAHDDKASDSQMMKLRTPLICNTTTVVPIPTLCQFGRPSYFPELLYTFTSSLNFTNAQSTPAVNVTFNGHRYLWLGGFLLRDDPEI